MEKPDLNPCPFCGSTDRLVVERPLTFRTGGTDPSAPDDFDIEGGYVWCDNCGTSGSICDTEEEAIEKWNGRNAPENATANVIALIQAERQRQITAEGYTTEHDDAHTEDELAFAAACYALYDLSDNESPPHLWPWGSEYWKPSQDDRIPNLVKAGALIAAEIERLQRRG